MGLGKRCSKRSPNRPKHSGDKTKQVRKQSGAVSVMRTRVTVRRYEQFHDKFLSYAEIRDFLQKMVTNYPRKIEVNVIGQSSERKPIYLAKISERTTETHKMATLVVAGSDGTDWMAVSSALFLIEFLTKNNSLTKIMDYLILPCSNPDAYHYSFSNRKSTQTKVTMNLSNNFPVTLGLNDMSLQSTEDILCAVRKWKDNFKYASSETAALIQTLRHHASKIRLFVSLQEGGEKIAYPFGFCKENIYDSKELEAVARAVQNVVKCRCFQIGSVFDVSGLTFGTVIDYLRTNQQTLRYTYILHLYDKKKKVDTKNIISYGTDTVNCIKSMARNVYMHYKKLDAGECCA